MDGSRDRAPNAGRQQAGRPHGSQALRFDEVEGRFDAWLLCVGAALAGLGVVMVASSSMPYAVSN